MAGFQVIFYGRFWVITEGYLLDLMVRLDNLYFQYRQGFFPEDFFENVKQSIRMTQPLRSTLGIDVERILLSQTFRDLVHSIDDSRDA